MPSELRKNMLKVRRALSPEVIERHSELVCQRLLSLPEFSTATKRGTIGSYLGISGEIDPSVLLETAGIEIALPVTTNGDPLRFVVPHGPLSDGPFGTRQPEAGTEVSPMDLALVLVPLVAADRRGSRVGHGAGFYDKTFSSLQDARLTAGSQTPLMVGLCHDFQVVETLEPRPWDVPLDLIVTEVGLIRP